MKKKIVLGLVAVVAVAGGVAALSAYEAHVINVTAHIENALYVHPQSRNFGTMFPQEYGEMGTFVTFSESFSETSQTRVSNIDYKIVQKPKPRPEYESQIGVDDARKWCHDNYPQVDYDSQNPDQSWVDYLINCYPSLCPYLSKTPANLDGNDSGVPAFHDPSDPNSIAKGSIDKYGVFAGDNWTIDLAVPCFEGQCAQDWSDFVKSHNPDADPDKFMAPAGMSGEVFGCDLWFEVTDIY